MFIAKGRIWDFFASCCPSFCLIRRLGIWGFLSIPHPSSISSHSFRLAHLSWPHSATPEAKGWCMLGLPPCECPRLSARHVRQGCRVTVRKPFSRPFLSHPSLVISGKRPALQFPQQGSPDARICRGRAAENMQQAQGSWGENRPQKPFPHSWFPDSSFGAAGQACRGHLVPQ